METEEIEDYENVICPYCKVVVHERDGDITDWEVCKHTIFLATDEGFEYVREDMKELINKESAKGKGGFDSYTDNLSIEGVRIASYSSPPGCFGIYWGFVADNIKNSSS